MLDKHRGCGIRLHCIVLIVSWRMKVSYTKRFPAVTRLVHFECRILAIFKQRMTQIHQLLLVAIFIDRFADFRSS